MEQHAAFKSSLFGFDKKLVLDYIFAFSQQAKEIEDELNRQIADIAASRDQLSKQLEEAENQFEIVNAKYSTECEASRKAAQMIAELGEEIQRQKQIVHDKDRELAIQNERCNQLQLKARSMELKSRKYDELSQQIGEIVLEAQAVAQQIVAQAKGRVAQLEEAGEQPEQESADLKFQIKQDLDKMKAGMNDMFSALSSRIEALETGRELLQGGDPALERHIANLNQEAEKMQADVTALHLRLTRLEAEAAEKVHQLVIRIGTVEAGAAQAVALADKVSGIEQNVDRVQAETSALVERISEVEARGDKEQAARAAAAAQQAARAAQHSPAGRAPVPAGSRQRPSGPVPPKAQDKLDSFFRSRQFGR